MGLGAGVAFWYRAQLVDKTGNESGFTDWVRGQSSSDAGEILDWIGDDIQQTEAWKQLATQIDTNTAAIIETALANDADVYQKWQQFGENRAGIIETKTAIANETEARAEALQLVTARIGENEAAIETKATTVFNADGDGSAVYTIQAGITYKGQYYSAGMAIGAEVSGGNVKTQILFQADRFALMNGTDDTAFSPFASENGQVFINSGIIKDGSIDNAKIGNYIQSSNYVANTTGWRIDKSGIFEINGSGDGGKVRISNDGVQVYDDSGNIRVKVGKL